MRMTSFKAMPPPYHHLLLLVSSEPWFQTMTGSLASAVSALVQMFKLRQSSLMSEDEALGQAGPKAVALKVLFHDSRGCGAFHRF
jgi:hypothetical protein